MSVSRVARLLVVAALILGGCSGASEDGETADGTADVATDQSPADTASPDATPDAGPDATPDAGPDATLDVTPDATPDAGPDTSSDVIADTTPDAVPDATPDAGPDATADALPDATPDAVPDTTADAVPDTTPGDGTDGGTEDTGAPTCADAPTCECFLSECAFELGAPTAAACQALSAAPDCTAKLLAGYQAGGCGESCGGLSKQVLAVLCEEDACSAFKDTLTGIGFLEDKCESCLSWCTDDTTNGAETDTDCGGAYCPACPVGKACESDVDCASTSCDAGVCSAFALETITELQQDPSSTGCTDEVADLVTQPSVRTIGILTSPVFSASDSQLGAYIGQDPSGPSSGILVVWPKDQGLPEPAPGDLIQASGDVREYFCRTEMVASELELLGSDTVPTALTLTPDQVSAEQYEGTFVRLEQVEITDASELELNVVTVTGGLQVHFDKFGLTLDPTATGFVWVEGVVSYEFGVYWFSATAYEADVFDPCATSPCANGGACTAVGANFSCACVAGFKGDTCQTNIDDCAPNPCLNGWTCTDGVDGYSCAAGAPPDGIDCGAPTAPSGGSCGAALTCNPVAGDSGTKCNAAAGQACDASGSGSTQCYDGPGNDGDICAVCDGQSTFCKDGYTCAGDGACARYCCTDGDCSAGGTCDKSGNGLPTGVGICLTKPDVDACAPNPCPGSGTCTDGVNGYSCAGITPPAWADCGAPTAPSGGSCGAALPCNPVAGDSGTKCNAAAGQACDGGGFGSTACYDGPGNDGGLCAACGGGVNQWCKDGYTCNKSVCVRFCCTDGDCSAKGTCNKFPSGPSDVIGICLTE
ncbi:MAG: hypothetical protein H6744_20685 [Deltaproteobacteria bacterium]|nr:hypothetical protein [Deltaproteobacteria bacterium]